jgi:ABC-type transport system substrate-binding protein
LKVGVLLAIVFAAVAAGCGGSDTADAPAATEAPATTTTIAVTTTTSTTTVAPTTTTAASTTTTAAGGIVPGEDADVDAVVATYQVVFSSATTYEEKVLYLIDPEGLEETVVKYQETGASMGGVELVPSAVTINGETADVTYDLLFGGTPTYPGLSGDALLIDETWKVTRDMFCGMMASARVGCPGS